MMRGTGSKGFDFMLPEPKPVIKQPTVVHRHGLSFTLFKHVYRINFTVTKQED